MCEERVTNEYTEYSLRFNGGIKEIFTVLKVWHTTPTECPRILALLVVFCFVLRQQVGPTLDLVRNKVVLEGGRAV